MAPADVQNTAVAAAWTMVAATEMAKPTLTPVPPTEVPSQTPLPTFTAEPLLIPTLEVPATPTTAAATGDCNGPINMGEAGPLIKRIRIENKTKSPITVSLYLNKNLYGQCGFLSRALPKNGSTILEIPSGSWWASAFVNGSKPSYPSGAGFTLGPSKTSDLLRLVVTEEKIIYSGP